MSEADCEGSEGGACWLCSTAAAFCLSVPLVAGDPVVPSGTSSPVLPPRRCPSAVADGGLVAWIGNLVSAGPAERSLLCPPLLPLIWGAGLVALDLEAMARFRASVLARRLLSSVLMARSLGVDPPSRPAVAA